MNNSQKHDKNEQQLKGDECSDNVAPPKRDAQNTNEDQMPDPMESVHPPEVGNMAFLVLVGSCLVSIATRCKSGTVSCVSTTTSDDADRRRM